MRFLLIHGPWHGSWQWEEVAELLTLRGCSAEAPTLLGHAPEDDRARLTMADYVENLFLILEGQPSRVFLVVHSAMAAPLRWLTGACAERLLGILFLNPVLAPPGRSLLDILPPGSRFALERLAAESPDRSVPPDPTWIIEQWMPRSLPGQRALVHDLAVPQPLCLLDTPLPGAAWSECPVPRAVLQGSLDRSLTPTARSASLGALGGALQISVEGGHDSPLTHAHPLAEHLLEAARRLHPRQG